jgi:hypothetical protein
MAAVGIGLLPSWLHPQPILADALAPELHVLNRLTWGIRTADVAQIQALGMEGYIDWQLNASAIADSAVDDFVASRRLLTMSAAELMPLAGDQYGVVLKTMLWARLYRAIFSERQLFERMVEFWTDHFNVPIGDYLAEKIIEDRDVVRRYALGRFRDLLFASAQSPAILLYLDNAVSSKDHPNENYARELMELHTLGVDGGYTEQDVVEVARAFTGWGVRGGEFFFDINQHDMDEKIILGVTLPAGRGIEDGLQVLDMLATHPSTAGYIGYKLCRRFISDTPPDSILTSTAAVFTQTDGDLRQVMRHIFMSSEFMQSGGQKFRRPMEMLVAMIRALHPAVGVSDSDTFIYALEAPGHLPFFWHPPNGYPDVAGAWMNTNSLLSRWNMALNLGLAGDGYFDGISLNLNALIPSVATAVELVDAALVYFPAITLSDSDRELLIASISRDGNAQQPVTDDVRATKLPVLLGLLLSHPAFQWA